MNRIHINVVSILPGENLHQDANEHACEVECHAVCEGALDFARTFAVDIRDDAARAGLIAAKAFLDDLLNQYDTEGAR